MRMPSKIPASTALCLIATIAQFGCTDSVEDLALPAVQTANATTNEAALAGVWRLDAASLVDDLVPADITIEFTDAGTLITREAGALLSQGVFEIEGNRLTIITRADHESMETREIARITRLTPTELELVNEADNTRLLFKRTPQ